MAVITKDTIINDLLKIDINLARYLFEIGMHCVGCPASAGESIEQACAVHGIRGNAVDELVDKMNSHLEAAQYAAE